MSASLPCGTLFRRRWVEFAILLPAAPLPSAAPRRISPTCLWRPQTRIPCLTLPPTFWSLLIGQLRVRKFAHQRWPRNRHALSGVFRETRATRRWMFRLTISRTGMRTRILRVGCGIAIVADRRKKGILIPARFFSAQGWMRCHSEVGVFFSLCMCASATPRSAAHAADGVSLMGPPLTCESCDLLSSRFLSRCFFCGVLFFDQMGRFFLLGSGCPYSDTPVPAVPLTYFGPFGPPLGTWRW